MKKIGVIIILLILLVGCVNRNTPQDNPNEQGSMQGAKLVTFASGRSFYLKMPESSKPLPVIIALHGRRQTADAWMSESFPHEGQGSFTNLANSEGFAVIAPNADVPFCDGSGPTQWDYTRADSADLVFFKEIFDYIAANSALDASRVYVVGISSGGFMTSRLALHFGNEKIRAVVIHSAGSADRSKQYEERKLRCVSAVSFDTTAPEPLVQPRTLLLHGSSDDIVPPVLSEQYAKSLEAANVEHKLIMVENKGHVWFSDYNQQILDWFSK